MGLTINAEPVKWTNLHLPAKKTKKKIQSTHEAMVVLKKTHYKEIARGSWVARQIALEQGTVTAREMVNAMIAEGSLVAGEEHEHWVSVVFRNKLVWKWTGQWVYVKSTKTQGGPRSTKVWRLLLQGVK